MRTEIPLQRLFLVFLSFIIVGCKSDKSTSKTQIENTVNTKEYKLCEETLNKMSYQTLTLNPDKRTALMFQHSAKSFNQMGDVRFCKENRGLNLVTATFGAEKMGFFMTLCVPNECNSNLLNAYVKKNQQKKDEGLRILQRGKDKDGKDGKGKGKDDKDDDDNGKDKKGKDKKGKGQTVRFYDPGPSIKWDYSHMFVAGLFLFIIILNIIGTIYHFFQKVTDQKNRTLQWIEYFSLERNITKLFTVKQDTRTQSNNLDVFAGIRVIMIFYVIYGHVWLVYLQAITNPLIFTELFQYKTLVLVTSGFYAVDTFFYMGGFFSAYVLSKKLKQKGLSCCLYLKLILYRALRIIPAYAGMILLYSKILPFIGSGPLFAKYGEGSHGCDGVRFWETIFFIGNFTNDDSCAGWGWYLQVDFQMFLIAPILVSVFLKGDKRGCCFCTCNFIFFSVITILIYKIHQFSWSMPGISRDKPDYMNVYYSKPWCRILPYLFGILTGYYYQKEYFKVPFKSSEQENTQKLNCVQRLLNGRKRRVMVSLVGFALILSLCLGQRYYQVNHGWSDMVDFYYFNYSRLSFTIGIFLLILPTLAGHGRFIRFLFGNKIMVVFGRLSYCVYLVHLMIQI